jgi:O-antigen ligase/polysaccharide polymerase Wzy-like membrane protein
MRHLVANAERGPLVSAAVALSALAFLIAAVASNTAVAKVSPLLALIAVLAACASAFFRWTNMLAAVILVILVIPIRRYALPGHLPFNLEPYRLLVTIVVAMWALSLLVDRKVRLRSSGLEGPLALLFFAIFGSLLMNLSRFSSVETYAVKQLTFFISFVLVLYVVVSVARSFEALDFLIRVLTAGGAIVGATTIWESRTGYNVYNHLSAVIPVLHLVDIPTIGQDGRGDRAYASAQHAIPLGAALVLLIPLAIYLAQRSGHRRWSLCGGLLVIGSLATYSRTSVLMLVSMALVYAKLRPQSLRRFWPALVPALLAIHLLVPGTLGTLKNSFFPAGGLIAQQQAGAGTAGSGRLADLGPGFHEAAKSPLFGEGFGTRIVEGPLANANILDNQWLVTLLETGVLGLIAWVWLFTRTIRRLSREAKDDDSPRGWLAVGLAASIFAYATSMVTYDAFSFIQVTLILFILLAFAAALTVSPDWLKDGEPSRPRGTPRARRARGRQLRVDHGAAVATIHPSNATSA